MYVAVSTISYLSTKLQILFSNLSLAFAFCLSVLVFAFCLSVF